MDKKIRPLTFDDEDEIIDLIKVSLYNGDQLHIGELLPTESNVYNFYRFEIFPLIIDEEPLLGYFNDKLIGIASCTTRFNKMYKLKKSLALGMITITHPDHRRQGIATKLRTQLGKELYLRNIDSFVFEIKQENEASLKNAQKIAKNLKSDASLLSLKFEANTNVF
jgi:hypothetical protein